MEVKAVAGLLVPAIGFLLLLLGWLVRRSSRQTADWIEREVPLPPDRHQPWNAEDITQRLSQVSASAASPEGTVELIAGWMAISLELKFIQAPVWWWVGILTLGSVLLCTLNAVAWFRFVHTPVEPLQGTIAEVTPWSRDRAKATRSTWFHVILKSPDGIHHVAVSAKGLWRAGIISEHQSSPDRGVSLQGWWQPERSPIFTPQPLVPSRVDPWSLAMRYLTPLAMVWMTGPQSTTEIGWRIAGTLVVALAGILRFGPRALKTVVGWIVPAVSRK
ncbi:MAG: hypothetical protein M1600_05015 [Firmicutes bacterium]|nr:hypothetical protein [Bacillota bacterium]